jgi:hypothetical protein
MGAHGEAGAGGPGGVGPPGQQDRPETYNPWSVVNLVFHHLADEGLHPVLGEAGDPGAPAADLLRALGIVPAAEGSRQASEQTKLDLERIRAAFGEGKPDSGLAGITVSC